ncbi:Hypothetical protein PHPALM_13940 [Phytophthora palmivora]|uniref:Uncharacterized protein n=1 Tax=Phytophthora palmivora TaxID=4796 RepID=A0A2P4XW29_9STRA|nr:Hypothetical protein PHPALM_13940 [Phytophthora palmivora]
MLQNRMLKLVEEHGVDGIYNADQTAVLFEYLPKLTISARGVKTVWVRCAGKDNERVGIVLFGNSFGTRNTPFVIAKSTRRGLSQIRQSSIDDS